MLNVPWLTVAAAASAADLGGGLSALLLLPPVNGSQKPPVMGRSDTLGAPVLLPVLSITNLTICDSTSRRLRLAHKTVSLDALSSYGCHEFLLLGL